MTSDNTTEQKGTARMTEAAIVVGVGASEGVGAAVLRRTAREEYRAELLRGRPSAEWQRLLAEFIESPASFEDRADTAFVDRSCRAGTVEFAA